MVWGKWNNSGRFRCGILVALLVAGLLWTAAGCTRRFYRERADREVHSVLRQKDRFPAWKIEQYHVYPDPRARFADPTNPDRPPMPPDDPAAKLLGPNPQKPGKAGIAWIEGTGYLELLAAFDAENRAAVQPAHPFGPIQPEEIRQASLRLARQKEEGPEIGPAPRRIEEPRPAFKLRLDQAVELALINSREFQTRREDLYLAALPVTEERFSFAFQFFALEDAIREWTGSEVADGSQSLWRLNSSAGFTKLFSTGALLLFSYANRTVIDLTSKLPRSVTSVSDLNLDIVQPLLRGGGRAVTLEPLTQAERNLLYGIRSYARFRKEFYQAISAGGTLPPALINISGIGDSGLSPGVLRVLSGEAARPDVLPSGSGRLRLNAGADAFSQGYFPTILQQALLANAEKNVEALKNFLKLFQAYEEGGEVGSLQVGQVELQLLEGRSSVFLEEKRNRDALDNFKLQLGLPVDVPIDLDDRPLEPITRQLANFETVLAQAEAVAKHMDKLDAVAEAKLLRGRVEELLTQSPLAQGAPTFRQDLPKRWGAWKKIAEQPLDQLLEKLRAQRRDLRNQRDDLEMEGKKLEPKLLQTLNELEISIPYGELELALKRYETEPWKILPDQKDRAKLHASRFREVRKAFDQIIGELSNERIARVRPLWEPLPPVMVQGVDLIESDLEKAYEVVIRTALDNRLDLMNARAEVHDAWRQVAIFANSLLGTFNVGYHMDSTTPPDQAKPLAFAGSRTTHQIFFNGQLPLVRLSERNNYRASLIAYQRARRALMAAEDQVAAQVRAELRDLRNLADNFVIQKRAVELAYTQVESSLETFRAPPQVGAGGQSSASIAALTQQLLQAQARLPRAQNQVYTTWITYQIARQQLFLDLEALPLDFRGVWIDEYANRLSDAPADHSPGAPVAAADNAIPRNAVRLLPPTQVVPGRQE